MIKNYVLENMKKKRFSTLEVLFNCVLEAMPEYFKVSYRDGRFSLVCKGKLSEQNLSIPTWTRDGVIYTEMSRDAFLLGICSYLRLDDVSEEDVVQLSEISEYEYKIVDKQLSFC